MRHASGVLRGKTPPVLLRNLAIVGLLIVALFWSFQPGPSFEPASKPHHSSNSDSQAPGSNPNLTVTLVVARLRKDDTSWLARELPGFSTAIYTLDDDAAAAGPLAVPANKGHEVMAYLTYIITHYRALPALSIFVHAHQHAWHNAELLDRDMATMLRRLRLGRIASGGGGGGGFVNLRCEWEPGCPAWLDLQSDPKIAFKSEEKAARASWRELHPADPRPDVLAQPCCAQFAVSRERIRAVPLAEWERYRAWMVETSLSDDLAGRVWEYTWQWVLAGTNVLCPGVEACYCDNYGVCFGEGEGKGYERWVELREGRKRVEEQLQEEEKMRAEEEGWGEREELEKWLKLAEAEGKALVEEAIKRGDEML